MLLVYNRTPVTSEMSSKFTNVIANSGKNHNRSAEIISGNKTVFPREAIIS